MKDRIRNWRDDPVVLFLAIVLLLVLVAVLGGKI